MIGKKINDKEHFRNLFKNRMGECDGNVEIDKAVIESYRGKLPDELLMYWERDGWCSYHNGVFWLVNPVLYDELMQSYLAFAPKQWQLSDKKFLYVIARTAFGNLYVWEPTKGNVLEIGLFVHLTCLDAAKNRQQLSVEEEDFEMNRFIGVTTPRRADVHDASNKPLFERALKKLGHLKSNEMYGYKLHPALGGKRGISNLDKVDLFVYADIQLQLEKPTFFISDVENNTTTTF